jgi:aminoglycoside phosphotransferase (APT) family kinase protein
MALEAAAIGAAAAAGLAVPAVVLVDDGTLLGTAGMVMSRIEGETLAPRILRDPTLATARSALAGQLGAFTAGLHALKPETVPGLPERDPFAFLDRLGADVEDCSPTFELARRWLERNRPAPTEPVVVHGDLRLGNVIVGEDGLRAVLDWELVHAGDPLEDLAWLCVKAWRFGAAPEAAGVGTLEELFAAYEQAGGRPVDRDAFRWWLVEKTLEWGVICMRQAAVHLTGASRSVELAAIGRRVAEQEWDLLELLDPIATPPAPRPSDGQAGTEPGLYGRPTATELLEAVEEFLAGPATDATDGRVRFHLRVATNVVRIVERQLRDGGAAEARARAGLEALGAGTVADLCAQIRGGRLDGREPDLFGFLWPAVRDRLAVANPRHLPEG